MPKLCTYLSIHQKKNFIKLFHDLIRRKCGGNIEHMEETICNFELQTFSKFSVFQRQKFWGSWWVYYVLIKFTH